MTLEDYNALNEMLLEFRRESGEMQAQIDYNLKCIREAEAHLKSFQEMESDDFKVFSPRKAAIIHKKEMDKIRDERSLCEENNKILYRRKEVIDTHITRLESVLDHQSCDFTAQAKDARNSLTAVSNTLEDLTYRINGSIRNIERNPIQVKQDFAIIERDLKNLADKLKDIISCV